MSKAQNIINKYKVFEAAPKIKLKQLRWDQWEFIVDGKVTKHSLFLNNDLIEGNYYIIDFHKDKWYFGRKEAKKAFVKMIKGGMEVLFDN